LAKENADSLKFEVEKMSALSFRTTVRPFAVLGYLMAKIRFLYRRFRALGRIAEISFFVVLFFGFCFGDALLVLAHSL
jgi:hypothetical protein